MKNGRWKVSREGGMEKGKEVGKEEGKKEGKWKKERRNEGLKRRQIWKMRKIIKIRAVNVNLLFRSF